MYGDIRHHRRTRVRYTDRLRQQDRNHSIIMVAMSILGALGIVFIAFSMLEASLARQDKLNQEQLIWRCNGNGGADIQCLPYAKA
jgi:hypothetical protein